MGAGIIGQHLLRLLRALGSKARVVVVARYRFQEELALAGGANVVMSNPSRTLLGEAVGARFGAHHPRGRQPGGRRRPVL